MDKVLAAVHEAGHGVVQWLVGWEFKGLQMKVDGSEATTPKMICDPPVISDGSAARKALLVLLAGNAATQPRWPGVYNNEDDFKLIRLTLCQHFRNVTFDPSWEPIEAEPKSLLAKAKLKAPELMAHPRIREAVAETAERFANIQPDAEGWVWMPGADVVAICERSIGVDFQKDNPWASWVANGSDSST